MKQPTYGHSFQHYENYFEASEHSTKPERFNYAIVKFFYEGIEPTFEEDLDRFLWRMVRPSIECSRRQANRNQPGPHGSVNNPDGREGKYKPKIKPKTNPKNKQIEIEIEEEKDSNNKRSRFVPPTVEEVRSYCEEKGYFIDPAGFVDYYEASGWMRGNTHIKDWRACVRLWKSKDSKADPQPTKLTTRPFDLNELNRIPGKEV